jgi:lysine 6-dehydrogenase
LRPPIQRLFFSLDPIDVRGQSVVPRHVAIAVMESKLRKPASPDLVAFRVIVDGTKNGSPVRHEWELVDHFDPEHGITAMMRTTGYSLSVTSHELDPSLLTSLIHPAETAVIIGS